MRTHTIHSIIQYRSKTVTASLISICLVYTLQGLISPTSAQNNAKIDYILNDYLSIKEAQQENDLFVSEFRYEPGLLKFPKVEGYHRKEQYFYAFDEEKIPQLFLVVLQIDSGKIHYDIEFLLRADGQLVFCKENQNNPNFKHTELRFFFEANKLLSVYEGNAIITSSLLFHQKKIQFMQATARNLYEKFMHYARILKMSPE